MTHTVPDAVAAAMDLRKTILRKATVRGAKGKRPTIRMRAANGRWRSCRGITDLLARAFWPCYRYYSARQVGLEGDQLTLAKFALPRDDKREKLYKRRKTRGFNLGSKVHKQVARMVNGEGRDLVRPEPISENFMRAMARWNWIPLAAELPCIIPDVRVGTMMDVLAMDANGRYVLVENKVGYSESMHLARSTMKGPLMDIPDCPLNQHFVQLAMMRMMLQRTHNIDVPASNCFVLQGTASGITPYELPQWAVTKGNVMWHYFCEFVK
jgi:hypothetical protein